MTTSQSKGDSGPSPVSAPTADTCSITGSKFCRVVIQQCLQADLKFDTEDAPVSIGQGMVVFVCFLQGATVDRLESIVRSVMNVKLCEPGGDGDTGNVTEVKRRSVVDCGYDILVIPQATIAGKMKGTTPQYHGLVSKQLGFELFHEFVNTMKNFKGAKGGVSVGKVECGIYGARQILKMETNGPFTHVFEF